MLELKQAKHVQQGPDSIIMVASVKEPQKQIKENNK